MSKLSGLDQRITFQRITETSDGIGGTIEAWASIATSPTVWAKVTPRIGKEAMAEGRMNATAMATFTIRYREDITELDRIQWRGEAWNIRRVMRKTQRELYIEIDAERGVTQ